MIETDCKLIVCGESYSNDKAILPSDTRQSQTTAIIYNLKRQIRDIHYKSMIYRDVATHCRVTYRIVAMPLRVVAMSLRVVVC
jgi:hypothetical protein